MFTDSKRTTRYGFPSLNDGRSGICINFLVISWPYTGGGDPFLESHPPPVSWALPGKLALGFFLSGDCLPPVLSHMSRRYVGAVWSWNHQVFEGGQLLSSDCFGTSTQNLRPPGRENNPSLGTTSNCVSYFWFVSFIRLIITLDSCTIFLIWCFVKLEDVFLCISNVHIVVYTFNAFWYWFCLFCVFVFCSILLFLYVFQMYSCIGVCLWTNDSSKCHRPANRSISIVSLNWFPLIQYK